jgi:hypothetical protein
MRHQSGIPEQVVIRTMVVMQMCVDDDVHIGRIESHAAQGSQHPVSVFEAAGVDHDVPRIGADQRGTGMRFKHNVSLLPYRPAAKDLDNVAAHFISTS